MEWSVYLPVFTGGKFMNYRIFRIAEKNIRVFCRHTYIINLCKGYEAEEGEAHWDISIRITKEELEKEREKSGNGDAVTEGYLEALAVYRRICDAVLEDNLFLFHCSAVGVDGEAVLFTAPSGTGKSTQAALWKKYLNDRVCIVNDDKPLIRADEEGVSVYGTPWSGKHHRNTNCRLPVRAVIVLGRGEKPVIRRMRPGEAFPYLYQQIYHFEEEQKMRKALDLLKELLLRVPVYFLEGNISEESVKVVYEELKKDIWKEM